MKRHARIGGCILLAGLSKEQAAVLLKLRNANEGTGDYSKVFILAIAPSPSRRHWFEITRKDGAQFF
jgi:hypothetical protein